MSRFKYAGKSADSDASIITKGQADALYASTKVDSTYVQTQIAANTSAMVTQSYVDTQDGLRAKKTDVDTADANYVPNAQKGVANGVATIGSDGYIPGVQLPTVVVDRVPFSVPGAITFTGIHEVNSTAVKTFQAGTLTIPDPGWPYVVWAIAVVQGASVAVTTAPATNYVGTENYGRIAVLGPADKLYSRCITTGNYGVDFFQAIPTANLNEVPAPLSGNLTLDLWLSLSAGSTYSFTSAGAFYYAMVLPAI